MYSMVWSHESGPAGYFLFGQLFASFGEEGGIWLWPNFLPCPPHPSLASTIIAVSEGAFREIPGENTGKMPESHAMRPA
jgi:hypothetical protein